MIRKVMNKEWSVMSFLFTLIWLHYDITLIFDRLCHDYAKNKIQSIISYMLKYIVSNYIYN